MLAFLLCVAAYAQKEYKTAGDGFPTGSNTPEGAACDAVRGYLNSDHELWLSTTAPAYIYGDKNNPEGAKQVEQYEEFKEKMVKKIKENAKNPDLPKMKILKVYKARNFSLNGPGSMAYALFKLSGNMFVDILVDMGNEKTQTVRYQVLADKDKKWFFNPRPDLSRLLSMGLNKESKSTVEWKKEAK
jgi:hypothetical protein